MHKSEFLCYKLQVSPDRLVHCAQYRNEDRKLSPSPSTEFTAKVPLCFLQTGDRETLESISLLNAYTYSIKVYLDTNALERIFDDQSQARIYLEATAMQLVFLLIEYGAMELISSDALVFETERNPYSDRQSFIKQVLQKANYFQEIDSSVAIAAQYIEIHDKIKGVDALHLACAEVAGADYFVTCDDRMIKKYSGTVAIALQGM